LQDHAIDAQRELIQLLMQDLHTALATSASHGNSGSVRVVVHKVELPSNQVQTKSAPSPDVQVSPLQPKVHPGKEWESRPELTAGERAPSREASGAVHRSVGHASHDVFDLGFRGRCNRPVLRVGR
jgi:hypothetical protein